MTSSRFILIFLGFIFLIIIILSSGRIVNSIQKRFGNIFPPIKLYSVSPTPTPSPTTMPIPTPTPTTSNVYNFNNKSSPSEEIPATGPQLLSLILVSGGFLTGVSIKRLTKSIKA